MSAFKITCVVERDHLGKFYEALAGVRVAYPEAPIPMTAKIEKGVLKSTAPEGKLNGQQFILSAFRDAEDFTLPQVQDLFEKDGRQRSSAQSAINLLSKEGGIKRITPGRGRYTIPRGKK